MLKVCLVERRLKWLLEVPTDNDTDFTVRQFLYQLLYLRLKIKHQYLHYGLYVHSEKKEAEAKAAKKGAAEEEAEGLLVPILNLNRTVD